MVETPECPRCGEPLSPGRSGIGRDCDEEEWYCNGCNEEFLYQSEPKRTLLYAKDYVKEVPVAAHLRQGRPVRRHKRRRT